MWGSRRGPLPSWDNLQVFIHRLNVAAGNSLYRLPAEAEWEYVCRAGTTTRWSFGNDESLLGNYAWYTVNAWDAGEQYAHQAGGKLPNPWGLYDVHGNVWEWVQDRHGGYSSSSQTDPTGPASGARRVVRGGYLLYDDPGARGRRTASTPRRTFATTTSARAC
ncbi:MAG: formylglycine-generating enzyme family protein [Candidatus Latescibacteria bacterium]|nr:formylglycine-generating enzyme family protein [Candidatus Latescibacterota bacterium]